MEEGDYLILIEYIFGIDSKHYDNSFLVLGYTFLK